MLPPDPLHINLLGCAYYTLDCLEKHHCEQMKCFFLKKHDLSKTGEGPGDKINGPYIKFILKDEILNELEQIIPESSSAFFNYFRSIKHLHMVCTARELHDYDLILHDFELNFQYLYANFGLNMTLKVHIIVHHYTDYFDLTRQTNGEFLESCYYFLKTKI